MSKQKIRFIPQNTIPNQQNFLDKQIFIQNTAQIENINIRQIIQDIQSEFKRYPDQAYFLMYLALAINLNKLINFKELEVIYLDIEEYRKKHHNNILKSQFLRNNKERLKRNEYNIKVILPSVYNNKNNPEHVLFYTNLKEEIEKSIILDEAYKLLYLITLFNSLSLTFEPKRNKYLEDLLNKANSFKRPFFTKSEEQLYNHTFEMQILIAKYNLCKSQENSAEAENYYNTNKAILNKRYFYQVQMFRFEQFLLENQITEAEEIKNNLVTELGVNHYIIEQILAIEKLLTVSYQIDKEFYVNVISQQDEIKFLNDNIKKHCNLEITTEELIKIIQEKKENITQPNFQIFYEINLLKFEFLQILNSSNNDKLQALLDKEKQLEARINETQIISYEFGFKQLLTEIQKELFNHTKDEKYILAAKKTVSQVINKFEQNKIIDATFNPYYERAQINLILGNENAAIEDLKRAHKLDPNNIKILRKLTKIYKNQPETKESIAYREKLSALEKKHLLKLFDPKIHDLVLELTESKTLEVSFKIKESKAESLSEECDFVEATSFDIVTESVLTEKNATPDLESQIKIVEKEKSSDFDIAPSEEIPSPLDHKVNPKTTNPLKEKKSYLEKWKEKLQRKGLSISLSDLVEGAKDRLVKWLGKDGKELTSDSKGVFPIKSKTGLVTAYGYIDTSFITAQDNDILRKKLTKVVLEGSKFIASDSQGEQGIKAEKGKFVMKFLGKKGLGDIRLMGEEEARSGLKLIKFAPEILHHR